MIEINLSNGDHAVTVKVSHDGPGIGEVLGAALKAWKECVASAPLVPRQMGFGGGSMLMAERDLSEG